MSVVKFECRWTCLITFKQKQKSHTLPSFGDYLHLKNLRCLLIPFRVLMIKKSCILIRWEHFYITYKPEFSQILGLHKKQRIVTSFVLGYLQNVTPKFPQNSKKPIWGPFRSFFVISGLSKIFWKIHFGHFFRFLVFYHHAKFQKKTSLVSRVTHKNPKTIRWPKLIQLVPIMLNHHTKIQFKQSSRSGDILCWRAKQSVSLGEFCSQNSRTTFFPGICFSRKVRRPIEKKKVHINGLNIVKNLSFGCWPARNNNRKCG